MQSISFILNSIFCFPKGKFKHVWVNKINKSRSKKLASSNKYAVKMPFANSYTSPTQTTTIKNMYLY